MLSPLQDLRRHKRIQAGQRSARLLVEGDWLETSLQDISGGGAKIALEKAVAVGRQVVISDSELGLISGTVVRASDLGPVIAFDMEPKRRDALVDKLTLWHNDALFG